MPELPEVETTVRAISKFQNKILKEIIVHNADLRWKVDKNISQLSKNKLIKEISPNLLFKGADYSEDEIVGSEYVKSYGGEIIRVKIISEKSTTSIIKKIKNSNN